MVFVTDQLPSDTKWRRLKAECQSRGELFEDSHFPAEYTSIDPNMPEDIRPYIVWRRPHELIQNPQMFTGTLFKSSTFDDHMLKIFTGLDLSVYAKAIDCFG